MWCGNAPRQKDERSQECTFFPCARPRRRHCRRRVQRPSCFCRRGRTAGQGGGGKGGGAASFPLGLGLRWPRHAPAPRPAGPRRSELATRGHLHLLRALPALAPDPLDLLHDVHPLNHGAEHDVLPVEPRRRDGAQEELRPVRPRARVRHRQDPGAGVLVDKVLVLELRAVDRLPAGAVVVGEVAALAHEVGDHAVEAGPGEAKPLLTSAQRAEVLRRLRHVGLQLHHDAPRGLPPERHVEVQGVRKKIFWTNIFYRSSQK
eukprot:gene393-biopygen18104